MNRQAKPMSRGSVLQTTLHVLLLVAVLGQLVFLAARLRARLDLTSDGTYSLTGSTRNLIANLDKRLVIEAYFSPKEDLNGQIRESRTVLDNYLDELVQLGNGKVVVQRFDPTGDKAIAERCQRLGIKSFQAQQSTSVSMSVNLGYQSLRLVHGGDKQKVVDQIAALDSFGLERVLTPAIKEVITKEKRKLGFMEWPSDPAPQGQQANQAPAWATARSHDEVGKRYEFQSYKDQEGVLIPADCEQLFLFRPKDLTDRQKYVVDQFLMRGGTLVVFADAADYTIGQYRSFARQPVEWDAKGSTVKFQDQLQHYGIDLRPRIVADAAQQAAQTMQPLEYLTVLRQGFGGMQPVPVPYPYFFSAWPGDWRQLADLLATDQRTGSKDAEKAEQYRRLWRKGIDSDDTLWAPFKKAGRGPGFYWPCWVDLKRKAGGEPDLPAGVDGKVHLWSSPVTLVQDPPPSLNPVQGQGPQAENASLQKFLADLNTRLNAEPRQQAPLMAEVHGSFSSFFAGKPRPKKASEIAADEEAKKREAEAKEKEEAAKNAGNDPAKADPAKTGDLAKDQQGPPPAPEKADAPKPEPEPEAMVSAKAPGRIVVIGDSDFLRDDFVRAEYQQRGGPCSLAFVPGVPHFFPLLLDWLAQDKDLLDLQSRVVVDRTLRFAVQDTQRGEDAMTFEKRRDAVQATVQWVNILLPTVVFAVLGLAVFLVRRAQKKSFLASIGN